MAPVYTPPNYNLLASAWTCDGMVKPVNGAADLTDLSCQKYVSPRGVWPITPPWSTGFYLAYHPPVFLRFPRIAPFDGPWPAWKVTCIECPQGSGQYYRAFWNDIQHEGFINEYALFVGVQCTEDLLAIPPAGASLDTGVGADACGNTPPASDPPTSLPPGPWPPSPPAVGDLFQDRFLNTPSTALQSHPADTGQSWIQVSGDMEIDSSGAGVIALNTVSETYYASTYSGPPDTEIILQFTTASSVSGTSFTGTLYRMPTINDGYAAVVEWDGVSQWGLAFYSLASGTFSLLQSPGSLVTLSASTDYILKVNTSGPTHRVDLYEGATQLLTENYTNLTYAGEPGIGIVIAMPNTEPSPLIRQMNR